MTGNRKAPENGDITLEGVSFAYRDKEVLHDVSLTLPQGSLTALVGPSGSGKSTLMKLCARFYDPQRGHVLFNGVRMDEIEPESLMRHISMVFQDVYLFQDTIRNNIRFGKADATDEQIVAAAKKACCHDFIMRLPKGYDTMVGEGGCTLSGGEKQRLSIARCDPQGRTDHPAGRGYRIARPRKRGRGTACHQYPDRRAHGDRDRPPAENDPQCRQHRRPGSGADRRAGDARPTGRTRRALCPAVGHTGADGGVEYHLLTVCGGAKTPKNRYCPAAKNHVTLHKTKKQRKL